MDVTDLQADWLLNEASWRALFERSTNFVALLAGPRHRFVYANPRYVRLVGGRDVVGRTVEEALPEAVEQGYLGLLDRVFTSGQAYAADSSAYSGIDREGRPQVRFLDFVYQPVCDVAGQVRGVLVEGTDVTERVRAQESLRRNAASFEQLVASMPFGLYIVDADFRIRQASAQAAHAFRSVQPLLGRDLAEALRTVWPEPFASEAIARFRHTLQTGEPYRAPATVEQRADLDVAEAYDWRIERLILPDGRYGVVCHFYDLSERLRLENELRASRQRFAAVLDSVRDFLYGFDRDGRFVFANRRLLDLWGLPAEQAIGRTMRELDYPPEVEQALLEGVRAVMATGEVQQSVTHYTNPSGVPGAYENVLSPVVDADGGVDWVVGSSRDISARLAIEHDLASSEARFRVVQDTSLDAFMILESVRDGSGGIVDFRWLHANAAAERIVGRPPGWFVGRRLLAEMPGNRDAGLFEGYVRVVETGEPWQKEFEYRHDGLDVYLRVAAARVDDGFAVTFADLTEHRRAQQAVAERERRFSTLANAMPQLVWTGLPDGRPEFLNEQWSHYLGLPGHEIASDDAAAWARAMHPDDVVPTQRLWRESLETGKPYETEFRLRRHDGSYRWFLARATPQFGPDGAIERWIGTCTDVDAAKRNEQILREQDAALREADRRKDEFLATLSHELRNPLAPIRNAVRLLASSSLTEERFRELTNMTERQVAHMSRLLDDLLDVARVTQGKLTLQRQRVPLSDVIETAVDGARPLIEQKRHSLAISLPPAPVWVDVDPARCAQAVSNLLTNAAKYTDAPGRIELAARVAGDALELQVRDTGIGLAEQDRARIFAMFVQVPEALDRAEGGLGIGLALVKGLVELHGGSVSVTSPGRGDGSTFAIHLPGVVTGARTDAAPAPTAAAGPSCRRLLVVDDNADAADSLAMLLEMSGHEVRVAYSGRQALTVAASFRPDVAMLDIGMPEMDGFELARHLRAEAAGRPLVLIALTGWGQAEDRARAVRAGFDEHLTKPVDPDRLEQLIDRLAGLPAPEG